ncbi:MAG: hypothetical protein JXQ65_00695 [Candidatus Marinimicrobia bacterium]|nr:hypothetical protein [Candidatus Neomarinimicrobiota bacterium]
MDMINNGAEYIIMTSAKVLLMLWKPLLILNLVLFVIFKSIKYLGLGNWLYIEFDSDYIKMKNLKNEKEYQFSSYLDFNKLSKTELKNLKIKHTNQGIINGFKHSRCPIDDIDIAGKTIQYHSHKIFHVMKPYIILKPIGYGMTQLAKFEKDQLLKLGKVSGIESYIYFGESISNINDIEKSEQSNWYKEKPKIKGV